MGRIKHAVTGFILRNHQHSRANTNENVLFLLSQLKFGQMFHKNKIPFEKRSNLTENTTEWKQVHVHFKQIKVTGRQHLTLKDRSSVSVRFPSTLVRLVPLLIVSRQTSRTFL